MEGTDYLWRKTMVWGLTDRRTNRQALLLIRSIPGQIRQQLAGGGAGPKSGVLQTVRPSPCLRCLRLTLNSACSRVAEEDFDLPVGVPSILSGLCSFGD